MKAKRIAYWISTVLVAFTMFSGGLTALLHRPENLEPMRHLGYPDYFSNILGMWKVLATLAIIAPKLPRLKEWAYAGILFDLTVALASHLFMHDEPLHIISPIVCALIALVSWALRPPTRRIGDVIPAQESAKP